MSLRQIDKFVKWDDRAQQYLPVLWRREVLPSWLTFTVGGASLLAAGAGNNPPLTIAQPYSSVEGLDQNLGTPFEVRSLAFTDLIVGTLQANFLVMLKEVGEVRNFMNNPIHIRTMFGTGQQPALLREPYMFLSQHNISVTPTNLGIATAMSMYLCGAQYFPWGPELIRYKKDKLAIVSLLQKWLNRRQYVTPYWLTTDMPVTMSSRQATAGTTVDYSAKIGDDGHFEIFGHAVVSTGPFMMTVSEVKTKQTLVNGQITQINGMGDARFPTIYPTPYLVPAGYKLNLQITNLDTTVGENDIYVTFFGRKIYSPFAKVAETLQKTAVPSPADSVMQMATKPMSGWRR